MTPYALVLILLVLLQACGSPRSQSGELTGEVFIVTEGGQNIRLGLVEVSAIYEDSMKRFIVGREAELRDSLQRLRVGIREAQQEVARAKTALAAAEDVLTNEKKLYELADRLKAKTNSPYTDLAAANQIAYRTVEARNHALSQAQDRLRQLLGSAEEEWDSGALYFTGLPQAMASAKTDADGRFTLTLDRNQRVAVVASGSRRVGSEVERYYWMLWTSLGGAESKRILLGNDNLMPENAPEAVVRMTRFTVN